MTTISLPRLAVSLEADRPRFLVARGPGVGDDAWLSLRAEFGSEGSAPGREILVPAEVLLPRLDWFAMYCRRYLVGIDWCSRARHLIRAFQQDRAGLHDALRSEPSTMVTNLEARLAATRFTATLKPFQRNDLGRQLVLRHAADFSACGAGKTVKAYAAYELRRTWGQVSRMLVVSPLSAFDAWESEARGCFNPPLSVARFGSAGWESAEVLLVHYQILARRQAELLVWAQAEPTLVVLDEGHRIKRGRSGAWGEAALALGLAAAHRLLLTGTPAPQGLADLGALLEFLWPTQGQMVVSDALLHDSRPQAVGEVAAHIRPLFVRTSKPQLGLLPPQFEVIRESMTPLQQELYQALRSRLAGELVRAGQRDLVRLGQCVQHLVQSAVNPALLSATPDPEAAALYSVDSSIPTVPADLLAALQEYDRRETPWKYRRLALLLEQRNAQGRKVVVWSSFPDNLERLRLLLAHYRPAVIHGRIPSHKGKRRTYTTREQELSRFRGDVACRVLLANPAATGEGVSLHQACHDAIYIDRTFNAVHYLQSVDRIHRLGMNPDQETTVTFLISAASLDEVVAERIQEKAERLGRVLEDPQGIGMVLPQQQDEVAGLGYPEAADLAALFEHLRTLPDDRPRRK